MAKITPIWYDWIKPSFKLLCLALLVIFAVHGLFPNLDTSLIGIIKTRSPDFGTWLEQLPVQGLALTISILFIYALVQFLIYACRKYIFAQLKEGAKQEQVSRGESQPKGTSSLDSLKRKLYPDQYKAPQLLGREFELSELAKQCQLALNTPESLYVVSIWGPQGIGKTHLLYQFAKSLLAGAYLELDEWAVWTLNREFVVDDLLIELPKGKPCLLLWDDISLSEDASKKQLAALRSANCQRIKYPIVIILTTWIEQKGLTQDDRHVNAQIECPDLPLEFATKIYTQAKAMPIQWQGHPLLLRMMCEERLEPNFFSSNLTNAEQQSKLFELCQLRAQSLIARFTKDHNASPALLAGIAIASSSNPVIINSVLNAALRLDSTDLITLNTLGLGTQHQGMTVIQPLRPDLIGWAFALRVLGNHQALPTQWADYAYIAWHDFFNTERFLEFALQHQPLHQWVQALNQAQLDHPMPALSRAKAANNTAVKCGNNGNWPQMQDQLNVSRSISKRFEDDAEIQLICATSSANAVMDYSNAKFLDQMEEHLKLSDLIAQRFKDHAEIQLQRVKAIVSAASYYGNAHQWEQMRDQLDTSQTIGMRFKNHTEIQLACATIAANAVVDYIDFKISAPMESQLAICQEIAQRFESNTEIQLQRVKAVTNAVIYYGTAKLWQQMKTQLEVSQSIAELFENHTEIQLERAKAANSAILIYESGDKWDLIQTQLNVCQLIAVGFENHAEIQLVRAKAANNAATKYGRDEMWEQMQGQLEVSQKIALSFKEHAELQLSHAHCLFNCLQLCRMPKVDSYQKKLLDDLLQHFLLYQYLLLQEPFNEPKLNKMLCDALFAHKDSMTSEPT